VDIHTNCSSLVQPVIDTRKHFYCARVIEPWNGLDATEEDLISEWLGKYHETYGVIFYHTEYNSDIHVTDIQLDDNKIFLVKVTYMYY